MANDQGADNSSEEKPKLREKIIRIEDVSKSVDEKTRKRAESVGVTFERYREYETAKRNDDLSEFTLDELAAAKRVEDMFHEDLKKTIADFKHPAAIELSKIAESMGKNLATQFKPAIQKDMIQKPLIEPPVIPKSGLFPPRSRPQTHGYTAPQLSLEQPNFDHLIEARNEEVERQRRQVELSQELVNILAKESENAAERAKTQNQDNRKNFTMAAIAAGAAILGVVIALAVAIIK